MKFSESFKIRYLSIFNSLHPPKNGDARGDMFFALSASVAVHLGIFFILTTAAAMSTGLIISEDSILRVSLVSTQVESQSPQTAVVAVERKSYIEPAENRKSAFEVASIAPAVEKTEDAAITKESYDAGIISSEKPTGAQNAGSSSAAPGETSQREASIPGGSSSGEITIAVPRYKDNTHPNYPLLARMMGYEGAVLISAEVSVDGRVGSLKIKKSSGYAVLDKSAIETVKKWRFDPARKMGKPITMWVDLPIKFVLKNDEAAI